MKKAKAKKEVMDYAAWNAPPGGIVGVGILDNLYHGNPLAGVYKLSA
jgi:hypothetical protein